MNFSLRAPGSHRDFTSEINIWSLLRNFIELNRRELVEPEVAGNRVSLTSILLWFMIQL